MTLLSLAVLAFVMWHTPPVESYKINTYGCIMDGFTSNGGIIRNHTRYCIKAFSSSYGPYLILEAELRAILDVILLSRGLGISAIWVEKDLTTVIHCITRDGEPWTIQNILRQIRALISFNKDTISYIYVG